MARPALWTAIRDSIAHDISRGQYGPGDRLPTEAQLAARFGVNRHTVRRALAALAEAGTVHARRGAGVFVQHRPTPYAIGRRVRFHQNLLAAGRVPEKTVLLLETRAAGPAEAEALGLAPEAPVHVYEALSLSDGVPFSVSRSVFPAARLPAMLDALRETGSVTAAFEAHGIDDYMRERTEITAKAASPTMAAQLRLAPGAPVLRTVGVNVDGDGKPLEYGRTWFAADRVALTLGPGDA
ncbi:phosphonate metabolism transcriptional regulator PhnF [Roseibacterium sp. SDUM158017]|uniref:phosphonate metabolism transcriptional regulator PhnF n=1 Tax=Roseicyclus salinarum TaxID=3036773 RepID=UPI002415344B|nr:phosphonate metabolism transcriptional regulator PhnF [Roseibacterium sp. SDUM158017]MDG4650155.1 phosphonate metabolism transcriptional regulator PhnF [Roseibacterium sp. SDUM158017]